MRHFEHGYNDENLTPNLNEKHFQIVQFITFTINESDMVFKYFDSNDLEQNIICFTFSSIRQCSKSYMSTLHLLYVEKCCLVLIESDENVHSSSYPSLSEQVTW